MKCAAVTAVIFLMISACAAQVAVKPQPEMPWSKDLDKYPGLLPELGQLIQKLQHNVQLPPLRNQSRLLPLLPESTTYYAAFPNYGEASQQTLKIFQQELQDSSVLRDWWQHGELATTGPQLEDCLEKAYQLSQYLGEEVVVSGETRELNHNLLIVAEVRKPGLKDFLRQLLQGLAGKSALAVRVLDPQELTYARDRLTAPEFVVLVRPDFVVAAPNLNAVREFNSVLEKSSRHFVSTPFGHRLAQTYQGGAAILGAADLHSILSQLPVGADQNQAMFDRTGFADVKYLVWEHKNGTSQMELSFTGPRHGVASWLAAPAPLGSLDFVSPKAVLAGTVVLNNLGLIFDDLRELSTYSNPNGFAAVTQMEAAMNISLKQALLSHLDGEITLELDNFIQPEPVWKAILRVNDPSGLQQTLDKLLQTAQVSIRQSSEGEVTYRVLQIPSRQKPLQIAYAFMDGYLVIASSRETAAEGAHLHRTGESLAKSRKLLESLPPGRSSEASALLYEDPFAMTALQLRLASPQMAKTVSQLAPETPPVVLRAYGEESAIRETSVSGGADAGAVLVVAAIAIPNLLRARMAANEASAVATIRTVNVAQVNYSSSYPRKGYARDLATLGPDPRGSSFASSSHASLIEPTLGNASCTSGTWCTKSGFRFSLAAVCKQYLCKEFVVVGTPVASSAGARNFCSTSDGVVRFNTGSPLTSPINASECKAWSPLQ